MDHDKGSPCNFPTSNFISQSLGVHLCSQFSSFIDKSINQSRYLHVPGSLAFQEALNHISKFTGSFLIWFASVSHHDAQSSLSDRYCSESGGYQMRSQVKYDNICKDTLMGLLFGAKSRMECAIPVLFSKIASSTITHVQKELEQLQPFPVMSLAAALVPRLDNLSQKALAMPLENSDVQIHGHMDRNLCICGHQGSADLSFHEINMTRQAVEPVTGTKFPTILDNVLDGDNKSTRSSEVLVGTGSRSTTVFKVKSLKVYAFGLYVQPESICKSLGPKYASLPVGELNNQPEFFNDLLREDIHMTVKLVVNCNGVKIGAVRDAFEKSLRARLLKMNPNTDYQCLRTFDSYFSQDIPLPRGTTISFQQTKDGQLVTKIGGRRMGAVHSKDLCRAFFGMYIGDNPVSLQAKEEIATNVGRIIKRC